MTTKIIKIGNSKGIRLSKKILDLCHFENEVEITVTDRGLLITPKSVPRMDWDARFEQAMTNKELPEGDLFDNLNNHFDTEEWTW